ncbi:solute:sodium symporter family transporter [Alteromonas sp. KS69]|jgi:SSS family solute:Na+ symporter|nr:MULTISPECIES: solute:sodium symporter family transporter [unclassified Alteromonas]MBB68211.1 solute:sodium symporter family transporter [Rickettsiales bacterium]MBO7923565.1 solute:sodium symporter family transporter [Alteromonas sp. K632G]PHS54550.1 MAG: solute:sodium symporter family transporter [Alteromonas sp.]RUP75545.1 solute:sodium symporter family transporter [Alteromonas sp. KS69]|tara:strand:- start:87450 stop:89171 length:1722 start_codon:yes stop_codon:yes gene_type:complete
MNVTLTLLTCMAFMAVVAIISYMKTKGEVNTQDGYFLAGRGLTGTFIAGSMILTNLSAEQLIGLNGSAFGYNLSAMAWEVTAGISTIIMALIFLPRYLAGAFSTLPEFLRDRFDDNVRRMTVVLFMVGYTLITIPSVLYSGSIAVLRLFDVPGLLNLSYEASLIVTIIMVGSIGALYAIFGGLKAVAVSDTINGVGLLIVGLLVPILGLIALGDGSFAAGLTTIATTETEKLNAIGGADDPVPFGTIFTGMILANLFYWGTNQYVIQRTLGAKNLIEGQKGVLFSGYFKVLVPFMMMLPGVIAYHLYQNENLQTIDLAYPHLVKEVLPQYLSGFFLAVLLGAVFSSFNSLLNSAATLFCLDVYKPFKKDKVSDSQLIRVAKITSLVIAVVSFITAPLLMLAPEGLWQIIRIFTGFYNIPVITIVLVGLFTKNVPALAAKVAIIFHVIAYALLKFVWQVEINFIHIYAILFAIELGIMLAIGHFYPMAKPWRFVPKAEVDMTPWRYAIPCAIILVGLIVTLYLMFSPVGFVGGISNAFIPSLVGLWSTCFVAIGISLKWWRARYELGLKRLAHP